MQKGKFRRTGRAERAARASPTPHHTLNKERSARFTTQPLSALGVPVYSASIRSSRYSYVWNRYDAKNFLACLTKIER